LGNKLNLVICDKNPYINADYIYAKNKEEAMQYIYSLAFDIFNERLMAIKPQFNNLPEFRLRVRKMKTRWGVCNKKSMTITLNLDLILKDVHLIDYVIVHELCHFKYMDHSPAFWRYVGTFYPYYKQARRELNR
jgi:predicted metal-dependent hydrolase